MIGISLFLALATYGGVRLAVSQIVSRFACRCVCERKRKGKTKEKLWLKVMVFRLPDVGKNGNGKYKIQIEQFPSLCLFI